MDSITIKQLKPANIEGGYLMDGFPSVGLASAIATESMIRKMKFDVVGVLDSHYFVPLSIVTENVPHYPTRILVNQELKLAIFSSYINPDVSLERDLAHIMFNWAKEHKCSFILSSARIEADGEKELLTGVGSTDEARKKILDAGIPLLTDGIVSGIPGILLNEGMITNTNVMVVLVTSKEEGPDYKASAKLCMAISKLVPGVGCDVSTLQKETEAAERDIRIANEKVKMLKKSMYS